MRVGRGRGNGKDGRCANGDGVGRSSRGGVGMVRSGFRSRSCLPEDLISFYINLGISILLHPSMRG